MTRSPREAYRPWARGLPSFVIRFLLLLMLIPFMIMGAWDGGMKDGWREFKEEWHTAGFPPIKKKSS